MKLKVIAASASVIFTLGALAADAWKLPMETAKLKPGPNAPLAIANCTLCHSADYLSTQPPLTRQAWRATVEKMRLKYGAPIATNNVDALADYLSAAYAARSR